MMILVTSRAALSCLAAVLLMCGPVRAQISCYSCSSDLVSGADVGSCRAPGSSTNTASNCQACGTSVVPGANGILVYTRSCQTTPSAPGCISQPGFSTSCSCNTSMCNSFALPGVGTLSCYSCSSNYPLDNGCGEKIIAPAAGVNTAVVQVTGCTSCTKTVTFSSPANVPLAGPVYTRGCSHVYETSDYCSQSPSASCSFKCFSDLCNSSTRLISLGAATPLLAAILLILTSWGLE